MTISIGEFANVPRRSSTTSAAQLQQRDRGGTGDPESAFLACVQDELGMAHVEPAASLIVAS
ncbi:hypothetical protein [Cupriavidus necator]|uniref:hypothetical protein n=1 Tax=Cupriavidus necator TaxID=106590 RepID=UPI0030F48908